MESKKEGLALAKDFRRRADRLEPFVTGQPGVRRGSMGSPHVNRPGFHRDSGRPEPSPNPGRFNLRFSTYNDGHPDTLKGASLADRVTSDGQVACASCNHITADSRFLRQAQAATALHRLQVALGRFEGRRVYERLRRARPRAMSSGISVRFEPRGWTCAQTALSMRSPPGPPPAPLKARSRPPPPSRVRTLR